MKAELEDASPETSHQEKSGNLKGSNKSAFFQLVQALLQQLHA
tara:strand:- start:327 stop:455 length:129 start_codon:yes stop_codon:yes gene_type:complete